MRRYISPILLLLITACNGSAASNLPVSPSDRTGPTDNKPGPEPEGQQPNESDDVSLINSLFSLHPYGQETDSLLYRFEQTFISDCMASFGFEYEPLPYIEIPTSISQAAALIPPLPSTAAVELDGYYAFADQQPPPPDAAAVDQIAARNESRRTADTRYSDALIGSGDVNGGCGADADDEIRSRFRLKARDEWQAIAVDVGRALNPGRENAAVAVLFEDWSKCMREHGVDAPATPFELTQQFPRLLSDPPSDREVEVAKLDSSCREDVEYVQRLTRLTAQSVRDWLEANSGAVTALRSTTDEESAAIRQALE